MGRPEDVVERHWKVVGRPGEVKGRPGDNLMMTGEVVGETSGGM